MSMEYIKEITADFSGENLFGYITAVQGDTARTVKVKMTANYQPYTPEEGTTAVLRAVKPDGKTVFNDATIETDGTVTANLTEQITAAVGNVRCELSLYGAQGGTLTTVKFIVKVTPASVSPEITSSDEFLALEQALKDVANAGNVAQAALETATEALDKMEDVEADIDAHTQAAEVAAGAANSAATLAETKAGEANTAAGAANSAATNAEEKATAANNAATAANNAATNATEKATAATNAATAANTAAQAANTKAGLADAAATAANTAAERAETAAEQAEEIVAEASGLVTRYGVRFEGSANSGATVTRLYNAVGLVAGVGTDTEAPQNDFDSIYPWSARRRCCGYWDTNGEFVVNAYKGEPGYTEDGTNGEVWVEHSLFYYRHIYDGDAEEIAISATPLAGYSPAPIFLKNGGQDAPYQKAYTAAYPMALVDAKPTSRTGVFPDIYSLNTAMTDSKKAGDAYIVTTCAEQYTECLYMWVEFATRDVQTVMKGATSLPYSASDTATVAGTATNQVIVATATAANYVVGQTIGIGTSLGGSQIAENRIVTAITAYDESNSAITFDGAAVDIAVGNIVWAAGYVNGTCNSVIASSGSPTSNTSGKYNCVYRGKEAPYGNVFNYISDILVQRAGDGTEDSPYTYTPYYLPDPTKYANGTITEDYVALQYNIPSQDGYAKKLGIDSRYPWVRITSEIGAGSTTYYSDYYHYPRYTVCAARVGGYWSRGSSAGPCYWDCSGAPSSASANYRARLSYHRT